MAKKTVTADKKASSESKSNKKARQVVAIEAAPAIEVTLRVDDDLIRERAHGIWIVEGRPHGRELAHWQRAHQELEQEAQ